MASKGGYTDPKMCRCWDYDFRWTSHHLTADQMEPLRHQMDSLASDCIEPLNSLAAAAAAAKEAESTLISDTSEKQPSTGKPNLLKTDMYALLRDNHDKNEALEALWKQVTTIPDWVDWEQIDRGQRVYYRYGQPMTIALAFQSLLGGMGAGKIVETLSRTGGFSAKVVRHRLLETFQHTLQVSQSLESIRPGGAGHASTIRVRLLHAAVRNRILNLSSKRPAYYDVDKVGVPINDLDCIGTICSFAPTVIWIGLPRQGIHLSEQEAADYIALWRLVAWYIGTPTEWFESPEKARGIMESILVAEVHPTRMSGVLARNIILGLEKTPPLYASRGILEAMTRQLIGTELANALGIGHPSPFAWAFAAWVFLYGVLWSFVCRAMPFVDSTHIESSRTKFWKVLMDVKTGLGQETSFDFKYIPQDEKK